MYDVKVFSNNFYVRTYVHVHTYVIQKYLLFLNFYKHNDKNLNLTVGFFEGIAKLYLTTIY